MVAIKFIRGGKYGGIAWFGEFVQATLRTNKHVFRIRTMKFGKGGGPLSMTEIVVIGNFEFSFPSPSVRWHVQSACNIFAFPNKMHAKKCTFDA